MTLYLRRWDQLTDEKKRELGNWFNYLYPAAWSFRRYLEDVDRGGPIDMEIEFIDDDIALLFKLTWGGVQ